MNEPFRILILEDNPVDAELIQFELQEAGLIFTAKVVAAEKDFVHELQEFPPDLILSDYDLPQYNGALALAEARRRCPDIPFILVTGAVSEDRAIEILTQGAKDYVLKTRIQQRLGPAVRRAITEAEEHQARKRAEEEIRNAHRTLEERVKIRTEELQAEITTRKQVETMLQRNSERLEILSYSAGRLLESDNPQAIVDELCHRVMAFLDCHVFFNYLVDENLGCLHLNAYAGIPAEAAQKIRLLGYGIAVCECVALDGTRIVADDIQNNFDVRTDLVKSFGIKAYACHPLVVQGGVVGTLSFGTRTRIGFSSEDLAMMKDIADQVAISMARIRTENALRESEERYRELVQSAPDAVIVHRNGQFLYANPAALRLYGAESLSELQRKTLLDLIPADERAGIVRRMEQGMTGQRLSLRETRLVRLDGRVVPVESVGGLINYDRQPAMQIIIRDIADRKKTYDLLEKARIEAENDKKRLGAILEAMPVGMAILDAAGGQIHSNRMFEEIWGNFRPLPRDVRDYAAYKAWWADTGKPVKPEEWASAIAIERGEAVVGQLMEIERFDGTRRFIINSATPIFDADGKIAGSAVAILDTTDLKRTEEELRNLTERFRLAQQAAKVGTWDWDIVTGHIEWSTQMFDLFRLDPLKSTASFDVWKNLLHPEDIETAGLRIGEALRQKTKLDSDYRIVWPDGEIRWINAVGEGKYDNQGQPTRMLGICIDITERKRMAETLRESEQLYRAIGESIDYGVWVCDRDGRNRYASNSFLKLVGLTQEQCSNFGWGDVLHPDDAERTIAAWKECVRTGGIWDIEHRFRGVDGQWHSILARGVPVRDKHGDVLYWAGINLDISGLKQAETTLKERTQQLEEANRELENFSYSVSHDLKAPLRAIDGYSRMLMKKYGSTLVEDAARILSVIRSNTERMGVLIDDLLSFSRVLKSNMTMSGIDMNELVCEVWNQIQAMNQEREIDVRIAKLLPGYGDRTLIGQVFFNLFSNAVKFTKDRKPGIIEMSCYAEPGNVVYFIKDNGVGFDMAYSDKLFGVFQRLHSLEEYEGTGVGLAIVQRIVQRHGGNIWAEGEVDKGATFFFKLPQK